MADEAPRWLTGQEQDAWRAAASMMLQLPGPLDAQLQRDSGISLFEYFVLSSLSMAPDETVRMSELARLSNGSPSRLSNVAKRLEQKRWLRRTTDPRDRRVTVARLTPAGRRVVEAAAPGHVAAVRQFLIDRLTAVQVRTLAEIGETVRAGIECPDDGPDGVC
ncbi:MarR family winged helix-turn-helix transcriptional regulator [Jatrophihabitans fulvus]